MKILSHLLRAVILLALAAVCSRASAPDWLRAAARLPVDADPNAPAIVLLDESSLDIDNGGVATSLHRVAIKILRNAGASEAVARVYYNGQSGKVLDANAWLLRKDDTKLSKGKRDWIDIASDAPGAIIDEQRKLQMDMSGTAVGGDVFGFETRSTHPLVVAQLAWTFGWSLPVETERLSVTLPAGYSIDAHSYGTVPPVAVSADHRTWSWTALNRPYRPDEPLAPSSAFLDGRLMLSFVPPPGGRPFGFGGFANWSEVGALADRLNVAQCDTSPELVATVHKLTADSPDALAKIRALGGYVQQLRYIAINEGLRYGYGWKSRKASEVFACGYGDCKDKANLLRSMLQVAGIRSHRVEALLDRSGSVEAECPSPMQFNHAIVAIEVDGSIDLPAVIATEKWGKLLVFDATDPFAQVGDLPADLQGSRIHVAENGGDGLILLPDFSSGDGFHIGRQVELEVSANGAVSVTGHLEESGQMGAELRRELKHASRPIERNQLVTDNLGDSFRNAVVQQQSSTDDLASGKCTLSFVCGNERFMQRFQGRTAVVKMDVLSRKHVPTFSSPERKLPIDLRPIAVEDQITLVLPPGYVADELPAAKSFESPYGTYSIRFEDAGKSIVMKRSFVLFKKLVPADEYAPLRQFLNDIARADRTSVLLKQS